MFFKYRMHNNPKLAEQLMFGSSDDNINSISQNLWKRFNGNRFDYYLNIVKICGKPLTARSRYVIAMAYSWNSTIYCKKAIEFLELYLSHSLYKQKCIRNGIYSKEAVNCHLTEMYTYLGKAYKNDKNYDKAIDSFIKAIQYTPNITFPILKLSEIFVLKKDLKSAIDILKDAKNSKYAKYPTGQENFQDLYIDNGVLDKKLNEYQKRLEIENKYPYNQKNIRELVMQNLNKQRN